MGLIRALLGSGDYRFGSDEQLRLIAYGKQGLSQFSKGCPVGDFSEQRGQPRRCLHAKSRHCLSAKQGTLLLKALLKALLNAPLQALLNARFKAVGEPRLRGPLHVLVEP